MSQSVWIINPYGSLPSEAWATYRSTMLARSLAAHGYTVTQFISNFEHRSKTFRTPTSGVIAAGDRYVIEVIPSSRYDAHISLQRIRYERTFARHLVDAIGPRVRPDFVVLAEPSLFYYDVVLSPLLRHGGTALVLDVIDIWPELFTLVLPRRLRRFSDFLLAPLYAWRRRLYRRADGVAAVAGNYLEIAGRLVRGPEIPLEVVYWGYDDSEDTGRGVQPSIEELVARKQPDEVWALYAGTLGENYDIPAIVDLADRLSADATVGVKLKFLVAGDGPQKQLCLDHVSDTFLFLGRLGRADLTCLYRHSDIALSTYRGDSTVSMPIKAFDYLRYGLPIVNSLSGDIGALIRSHDIGVNYDASSNSSLAEAVIRLARDQALRRRMSANALALAGVFSADQQYRKFVRLLETVAAQRRARTQ
jgi:glycosyltransferase involved in cell wall biosynthesis